VLYATIGVLWAAVISGRQFWFWTGPYL